MCCTGADCWEKCGRRENKYQEENDILVLMKGGGSKKELPPDSSKLDCCRIGHSGPVADYPASIYYALFQSEFFGF
jgi:hypothetical protein